MNRDLDYYLVQLRRIEDHREAGAEKTIRKIYKRLLKELKEFIAVEYVNYAENDILTYAMLQQKGVYARFLEEVAQRINTLTPQAAEEILKVVEEIYSMAYSGMVEATEKSSTTAELREALSGLKGTTPEVVKRAVENPVSGLTLKDTLEKHRREIVYDIKRNISVGLMNGDRLSTVAKRISDSVDQDYRKAMTIARTETQRVREAGHLDAAKDLDEHLRKAGFCQVKIWRTKQDERVRPGRGIGKKKSKNGANHVRMQGVTLPVNEYFDLGHGVKTLAPGQSGDAKNDINCRCRLSYRTVPIDKVEKSDIIKLPKLEQARIPPQKFTEYALNPEKDADKARAFQEALGYNISNADKLIQNIREHLNDFPATEKGENEYGKLYEVIMRLQGENGRTAKVKTGWILESKTGELRLTSAYVAKKKKGEK